MARTKGAKDKKPRARSAESSKLKGIVADHNPNLPEGYNTRRIAFMQEILPTEPLDHNDVDEMERRFVRYLQKCAEWDMKIGNQAAYAAIGINKDLVYEWTVRRQTNPRRTEFVKKVQQFCAMYREGLMEDGKVKFILLKKIGKAVVDHTVTDEELRAGIAEIYVSDEEKYE